MTQKHTPGPWSHNDNTGRLTGSDKKFICTLDGQDLAHSLECRANARLIAAAPDLLEALEYCANVMEFYAPNPKIAVRDPMEKARAAIAKAKGT